MFQTAKPSATTNPKSKVCLVRIFCLSGLWSGISRRGGSKTILSSLMLIWWFLFDGRFEQDCSANQKSRHHNFFFVHSAFSCLTFHIRTLLQTFVDAYLTDYMGTERKLTEPCLNHSFSVHLIWIFLDFTENWGKQKFEMLTMQFPCCPSSATMENRILLHGRRWHMLWPCT